MKRFVYILGLSALHFVVGIGVFRYSFGNGMAKFDTGELPTAFDKILNIAVDVLWFPVALVFEKAHFTVNWIEWLLLVANSLLWGSSLFCTFLVCGKLFHWSHKKHEQPAA